MALADNMASAGAAVKDFLPIPNTIDLEQKETSTTITDEPTLSHELAVADHDEKGLAQEAHDKEVLDLGWHKSNDDIPDPLVGGLSNDDLWILIRRFNKQMYCVREYTRPVPGSLDLNLADNEEFSPDKLRASIERLYMTVGIGLLGVWKHIARLRSWGEARRTAAFCVAYSVAWLFDFIVPLLTLTIITLIVYPPSRDFMFPPAPLALVSGKTGGVQKPKAGVLGSVDSATGANEAHKGETVEKEAKNFVTGITSVAIAASTDSTSSTTVNAGAGPVSSKHDKTKVPMETTIWNQTRPAMHGIAGVCDVWERFGNAMSPTPPFPQELPRLRIAALVVPLLAVSIFVTSYMFIKGVTFGIGLGFFGDPVIQRGLHWLNTKFPNWQKLLELRNTVLKGVPTNAQLTITLLRVGEANKAPLPPAPQTTQPPPNDPVSLSDKELSAAGADTPLNATDEELKSAMEHSSDVPYATEGSDVTAPKEKSHSKRAKMLSFLKGGVKGGVETVLGADKLKAKVVGSEHSKQRLGVVPRTRNLTGPVDFVCRHHGKRGHAYISTVATIPCVSFSLDNSIVDDTTAQLKGESDLNPQFSIAIADIKEIRKQGGLGWKAKLVVGWALDREVADGLEIEDKLGNHWMLTAMILRDELFNRLIAMGGQKWEAW